MVKNFNLLELHDKRIDLRPFSWICFDINDETKKTIESLLSEALSKFVYKKELINFLKSKLNCSYDLIESYISFRKNWFAIPLFLELLKLSLNSSNIIEDINFGITYLKTSGPTSKKIKALKYLTKSLCEVAGAHAADGTLPLRFNIIFKSKPDNQIRKSIKDKFSKEAKIYYDHSIERFYMTMCLNESYAKTLLSLAKKEKSFERLKVSYFFRITDAHKDALESIKNNISRNFGRSYSLKKFKGVNAWTLTVANKIIIRYLIKFVGFNHGSKTNTIGIPSIIKNSPILFQDAFVRGFLQFDGSVELDGNINLQTKSKIMVFDLSNYFGKKGIVFSCSYNQDKRGCYTIKLRKRKNSNLSFLFFESSIKQQLLIRKFQYQPESVGCAVDNLNQFSNQNISIKLGDFLKLFLYREKTLYDLQRELIHKPHLGTLQKYANFLGDCNILLRFRLGKAYKYQLNNNIKSWRIPKND